MNRFLLFIVFGIALNPLASANGFQAIQPDPDHPTYWNYQGEPVLLIGGSDDDNLFQLPDLQEHLDAIQAAGGNYIRNTMSDRPDRGFEVHAYHQQPDGKFDLDRWNDTYWERFENLLRWTQERDIIVQIEVWDRFDWSRGPWKSHPLNPANHIQDPDNTWGLATDYPDHPGTNRQPFFFTTPKQRNLKGLLAYQQRFVDKMLSHSLKYDHVLYCIDNETSAEEAWAVYWRDWIVNRATEQGQKVYVTEMWDDWNLQGGQHRHTLDHPERFAFADVSQNNHKRGQEHWDNFQWVRQYTASHPRPLNTVKTYGADGNKFGHTNQDGLERFYRHLIGGAASARFHRPDSGLGLSEPARIALRSIRQLETRVKLWNLEPTLAGLGDRAPNEAYACTQPNSATVVYFPAGGDVTWDLLDQPGAWRLEWLDLQTATWQPAHAIDGGQRLRLQAPTSGGWMAVLTREP